MGSARFSSWTLRLSFPDDAVVLIGNIVKVSVDRLDDGFTTLTPQNMHGLYTQVLYRQTVGRQHKTSLLIRSNYCHCDMTDTLGSQPDKDSKFSLSMTGTKARRPFDGMQMLMYMSAGNV